MMHPHRWKKLMFAASLAVLPACGMEATDSLKAKGPDQQPTTELGQTQAGLDAHPPASCQDIKNANPSAADGAYVLFVGGDRSKPWTAYCHNVAGTPSEQHGGAVTSMSYAAAMNCDFGTPGVGNVDLRGTAFAVAPSQFVAVGSYPSGAATYSANNQVVELWGRGDCGWMSVQGADHPFNGRSAQLQLQYVPQVVYWPMNFEFGDARRTTTTGDWAAFSWKSECASGESVTGLSLNPTSRNTRVALCRASGDSRYPHNSCYSRHFSTTNNRGTLATGDWDPGYYKGGCGTNEFVAGVAQDTAHGITAVLCCPGAVAHTSCSARVFNGQDSRESSISGDWDPGRWKGECGPGRW